MAVEVFKLFGSIFVNNDEANKSISATDKKAKGVAGTLGSGIKTAAKWGTAIVGGATAAAGGLFKVAEKAAKNTDEIDKMSQKLGLSKTAYQEWDYVLGQAGVDINSLTTGTKTMTNQIGEALKGSTSAQENFDKLGISMEELQEMNREDAFAAIIQSLQSMEDSTERAALANKMFGKSGQNLTALFNESAESTDKLKKKAHELGMVMSDEAVGAGVDFTDNLDTLKRSAKGLFNSFASNLLPIGNKIMEKMQGIMPTISKMIGKLSPVISSLFDKLIPPLGQLAESILPVLITALSTIIPFFGDIANKIMPIFVQLIEMLLPPIIQIISELLPPLVDIISSFLPLIQTIFDLLRPIIDLILQLLSPIVSLISEAIAPLIEKFATLLNDLLQPFIPIIQEIVGVLAEAFAPIIQALAPVFDILGEALSPIFEILSELLKVILPAIVPVIKVLAQVISTILGVAIDGIITTIGGLKTCFEGIVDFITGVFSGDWSKAWEGIKKIFKGVWDTLYGVVKIPINLIIKGINFLWQGVYTAVKGIVDNIGGIAGAIGDIFGQDWHFSMPEDPPTIPELEEGGVLEKGQIGLLEGNGDEAVVPLSQNTEWIDRVADKVYSHIQNNNFPIANRNVEPIEKSPVFNINFNIKGVDIYNDNDIKNLAEKLSEMFANSILEKRGAFA